VDALDSGDTSLLLVRTATKSKGKGKKKVSGSGGDTTAQGELPIHHAARVKATEALCKMLMREHGLQEQLLLAHGAGGKLPLHYAAKTRHADTVSILCGRGDRGGALGLGGDLIARQVATADTGGRLPIHYAMESSDHATMLELVACGSQDQLTTPDPSTGTTAIHHAAKAGASDLVDAMISPLVHSSRRAALLHNCDEEGRLPVHCAVLAGDRKSTRALGFVDSGPTVPSPDTQDAAESTLLENSPRADVPTGEAATTEVTTGSGGDGTPTIPLLATDLHGKTALDYTFDAVDEAKADAELVITKSENDWNTDLDAVVASNDEAQAALVEDCAQKDAELVAKQATIEALQAEVASMKQRIQELTAVGATAGMDGASAEEGVPPV
jgi:ankyrin repeat protein